MNSLESDADLLAACRARQGMLDAIEDLESEVERFREREVYASLTSSESEEFDFTWLDPTHPDARLRRIGMRLSQLDRCIADAVMHHLLNPPPPPRYEREIAVLPRRA
jgi:hypothetical protein